jgi:hypothetical protein
MSYLIMIIVIHYNKREDSLQRAGTTEIRDISTQKKSGEVLASLHLRILAPNSYQLIKNKRRQTIQTMTLSIPSPVLS